MVKKYPERTSMLDMYHNRHAWKIDDTHYKVYGRNGKPYIVFAITHHKRVLSLACPCDAGKNNQRCYHAMRVYSRLEREKRVE